MLPVLGQTTLSLDSCRALALRNNKQLKASATNREVALYTRKAARTSYLPKVDAVAGYEHTTKQISLLNKEQKDALGNLGSGIATEMGGSLEQVMASLVQQGILSPQSAQELGALIGSLSPSMAQAGNYLGQSIVNAFKTDTRNMYAGSVVVKQPIYMGGAITAANRMADIAEELALNNLQSKTQGTLYNIDNVYWTVVSLRQKQKLANSYRELVAKLSDDVHKMIDQGVATKADGLKVDVRVNEADIQVTQVDDGLVVAKMLLCQLCGLPLDEELTLADENGDSLNGTDDVATMISDDTEPDRPELRMLQNSIDMSREATKMLRAEYLPHVALTGGYLITNPNTFDGFQKRFSGVWNIGVLVQVPVWNWGEGKYKIRASKASVQIAQLEYDDAREKIELEVTQSRFKLSEANKRLRMAWQNIASAEENLRCATLGFREGVIESSDVLAAQTAWQLAHSQKIDAEIEVRLAKVNLERALGILKN